MKVKIADEVKQEERSFKDLSRIDSFAASQKKKKDKKCKPSTHENLHLKM